MRLSAKIPFVVLFLALAAVPALKAQSIQHKVQGEETLFSIAQQYDVTVQQLKQWNNLSGNTLSIGQTLVIKKSQQQGAYIVKSDDTLFSIAQKFGVTVDQLKKWNSLRGTNIGVGQSIVVQPVNEDQPETQQIEPVVSSPPIPVVANPSGGYYTVKSGDTLFRIAQMHGMEVERLKALNNLASNNISVGQELKVEGGSAEIETVTAASGAVIHYELKRGMNLNDLLEMFEMSVEKFAELNAEMPATYLNKGQTVRVVVPETESNEAAYRETEGMAVLDRAKTLEYSLAQKGTVTTNGELYNPDALTAAHASMAIGSVIFIRNPANNRGVIVRINDRITEEGLKLSKEALRALDIANSAEVIIYRINE